MKFQVGDIIRAKHKLAYADRECVKGSYFIIISEQTDRRRYGDYFLLSQLDSNITAWIEKDIELCFEKEEV